MMAKCVPAIARVLAVVFGFSAGQATASYMDELSCERIGNTVAAVGLDAFMEYFVDISSFEEEHRRDDVFLSGNYGDFTEIYGPIRRTVRYYYELEPGVPTYGTLNSNANYVVRYFTWLVGLDSEPDDVPDSAFLRTYFVPLDTEAGEDFFNAFFSLSNTQIEDVIEGRTEFCPTTHIFNDRGRLEGIDFYHGMLRHGSNIELNNACVRVGVARALGLVNYPGNESILLTSSGRSAVPVTDVFVRLLHSLPNSRSMSREEFESGARSVLRADCGVSD